MKDKPAFPMQKMAIDGYVITDGRNNGMTIRQYYKAKAMQGFLSSVENIDRIKEANHDIKLPTTEIISKLCGEYADTMIAEDEQHANLLKP